MDLKSRLGDFALIALAAGTIVASQLDCLKYEHKKLSDESLVIVEKCSLFIDGQDLWEKSNRNKDIMLHPHTFKDKNGTYYICENEYCKKLF